MFGHAAAERRERSDWSAAPDSVRSFAPVELQRSESGAALRRGRDMWSGYFVGRGRLPECPLPCYTATMIHENIPAAIEGLSARIIAIRDSL